MFSECILIVNVLFLYHLSFKNIINRRRKQEVVFSKECEVFLQCFLAIVKLSREFPADAIFCYLKINPL